MSRSRPLSSTHFHCYLEPTSGYLAPCLEHYTVPCERVFSSSKETILARRNALSPNLMEALQLLKFATKQGRGLYFTEGWDKDKELAELEETEKEQSVEDFLGHYVFHNLQS